MSISVTMIDSAGGDLSVVNAARVSFDKESVYENNEVFRTNKGWMQWDETKGIATLVEDQDVELILHNQDVKLINYLARHKHMTPFRHNFIQLRCSVPLFLARQLMKHQAGLTWNEVSRRYVDDTPEFYYPEEWRSRPEGSVKQGSGEVVSREHQDLFTALYSDAVDECLRVYHGMIDTGIAPEMARMVLPQSMMVDFIWSGNLLAFHHVWSLRNGDGAQKEAQIFADLLFQAIRPVFPVSWKALTNNVLYT